MRHAWLTNSPPFRNCTNVCHRFHLLLLSSSSSLFSRPGFKDPAQVFFQCTSLLLISLSLTRFNVITDSCQFKSDTWTWDRLEACYCRLTGKRVDVFDGSVSVCVNTHQDWQCINNDKKVNHVRKGKERRERNEVSLIVWWLTAAAAVLVCESRFRMQIPSEIVSAWGAGRTFWEIQISSEEEDNVHDDEDNHEPAFIWSRSGS